MIGYYIYIISTMILVDCYCLYLIRYLTRSLIYNYKHKVNIKKEREAFDNYLKTIYSKKGDR